MSNLFTGKILSSLETILSVFKKLCQASMILFFTMLDDDREIGWQLTVGRWPMAVVGLRQLPSIFSS